MSNVRPIASFLILPLLLATMLSGCVGSGSQTNAPASFTDETGLLQGRVVSDEIFPVVGATVTTTEGLVAVTDGAGRFEVGSLAPGTVTFTVEATGYEPVEQSVEILAASVTDVTVTLIGIPGEAPYVSTFIFTGFIGCGWAIIFGAGWHTFTPCPAGANADRFKIEVGPDWGAGVHEMTWETPEEMLLASSMVETCANSAAGVDPCPALVSGKSPLKIIARPEDPEYAKKHSIDGTVMWPAGNYTSYLLTAYRGHYRTEINSTLYPACAVVNTVVGSPPEWGCPFGLGATTGLRSTLFHTTFYRQEPPELEGYSAIPDQ